MQIRTFTIPIHDDGDLAEEAYVRYMDDMVSPSHERSAHEARCNPFGSGLQSKVVSTGAR